MWLKAYPFIFIVVVLNYDMSTCDPITNTNFNSHLRDFASDDTSNITNVKTLQKADLGSHVNFVPAGHPIKFKETPDSALSGSSNSRGLLYHEHPGYTLNDYDDGPHLGYGHDYHSHDIHPDIHGLHGYDHGHHDHHNPHDHHSSHEDHHGHHNHHDGHHDDHHHGHHSHHDYGHHHYSGHHHLDHGHYDKHYKHALAAKTALWPLAGIALLGAAAALVSNPVLLQLGVVSGKRRRRDTEEVTGPDYPTDFLTKYKEKYEVDKTGLKGNGNSRNDTKLDNIKENLKKRLLNVKAYAGSRKIRSPVKSVNQISKPFLQNQSNEDDDRFIPIPIKLRAPKDIDNL